MEYKKILKKFLRIFLPITLVTSLYFVNRYDVKIKKIRGNSIEKIEAYAAQRDLDSLVLFTPGGLGGTTLEEDPGLESIIDGIETELRDLGHKTHVQEYIAPENLIDSFEEIRSSYEDSARELAERVNYLTGQAEDCRVLLTGRSYGAIFVNEVMGHLRENERVYSIITGFTGKVSVPERTLVINDLKDPFLTGDLVGLARIAAHLPVPPHEYEWPEVRIPTILFLHEIYE